MTVVAACGSNPLPSGGVEDTHTPHRNVRVADDRWKPFGAGVGPRNRSAWVVEFIDMVNKDPQLWRDAKTIAEKRGEPLGVAVLAALRRYVTRHRNLLDTNEPEHR